MGYRTRQREEILALLRAEPDRLFPAREIVERVDAGEATVFRTLSLLLKEGAVRRYTDEGRGALYQYDGCGGTHLHLRCRGCGRLFHVDCAFRDEMIAHFQKEHGFTLAMREITLEGLCRACAQENDAQRGTSVQNSVRGKSVQNCTCGETGAEEKICR